MKDVFDHSESNALWEKLDSMDFLDPGYTDMVKKYLAVSKTENDAAMEELRDLQAKALGLAAEDEPEDPCDEEFMEEIST